MQNRYGVVVGDYGGVVMVLFKRGFIDADVFGADLATPGKSAPDNAPLDAVNSISVQANQAHHGFDGGFWNQRDHHRFEVREEPGSSLSLGLTFTVTTP